MRNFIICDSGHVDEIAAKCKKYNSGIEIQAFYDPEIIANDTDEIQRHIEITREIKIKTMHGPFADLCFGSFDRLIKEATMSRYNFAYETAQKLGCTEIVLHHGYVPGTTPHKYWVKRGVVFWKEFFKVKNDDIRIHLENMLELGPYLLKDVVDSIENPNLDICLDIGHVNCHSNISVVDWIKHLNTGIGYVHMHNNNGENDKHLGIDKGTAPIKDICDALECYSPNATWAIETHNHHIDDSINWIVKNGYKLSDTHFYINTFS